MASPGSRKSPGVGFEHKLPLVPHFQAFTLRSLRLRLLLTCTTNAPDLAMQ